MLITLFKIRRQTLVKRYSQIEIQEKTLELLYYSPFFKLVPQKGRPRVIWHEDTFDDIVNQAVLRAAPRRNRAALEYLDSQRVFSRNWIEKDEFQRIVDNAKNFSSHGFGDV